MTPCRYTLSCESAIELAFLAPSQGEEVAAFVRGLATHMKGLFQLLLPVSRLAVMKLEMTHSWV